MDYVLSMKLSSYTFQVEYRYSGGKGLLLNLTPPARLETGILELPGEIGNMFLTK